MLGLKRKDRTFELSMSRDYVNHWGVTEAVRELLQNALDSESPFEYAIEPAGSHFRLTISSRYSTLTPSTLVLGRSSKRDDPHSIGSFGEGYKLALLVLTAQEKPIAIYNDSLTWATRFGHSAQFDCEVLMIDERLSKQKREGLHFVIERLTAEEIEGIRASCLFMQKAMGDAIGTEQGTILPGRAGKLYVGGLYVCDTKLRYGYDIKPEHLKLERDRQTVGEFDLYYATKQMWFLTERWEQIAELIAGQVPDLAYAEYGAPEMVKEACYQLFRRKHPGAVVAASHDEMKRMVERGMTNVVVVDRVQHAVVSQAKSYRTDNLAVLKRQTPLEEIQAWYDQHHKNMPRLAKVAFKQLIAMAATWRAA